MRISPAVIPVIPGQIVAFIVPGRAVPWMPSRVTKHGTYKLARLRRWQCTVAAAARLAYGSGRVPYAGPVGLAIEIRLRKGPWPDVTNAQKAIEDAIQGIVIVNDRQVVTVITSRFIRCSADDVMVSVWPAQERSR